MTTLKMPSNQNMIVGLMCLLFAVTGGVGGYNLKSRMQDSGKSEHITDLPVLHSGFNTTGNHTQTDINCRPAVLSDTTETAPLLVASFSAVDNKKRVKQLITMIHSIATQQSIELDFDAQVKTELEFIEIIDRSPELIKPLLKVYVQMPDSESKEFLRSLLSTTGSNQIQERAFAYLQSGESQFRSDWLSLLRDTGVHTSESRDILFNIIPTLIQPNSVRDAILAITPQIVPANERLAVVNQLDTYLHHSDELVRSAAIESISKWADNSQATLIEQALTDSSDQVRYAAISAAYSSGVRSNYIETILVQLMNNSNEDLQMRIHAYNALSNYALDGQNYEQFYQFHLQLLSMENSGQAKG